MISFLLLCVPIFGTIVLGWAATKAQLTSPAVLDALGAFSFRFALPALVMRLIASERLSRVFDPEFFVGYLACGSLMFALTFGVVHLIQRHDVATAGAQAATATVSNLGFVGPSIMLAFFGQRGGGPLAMAIVVEVMILMSVGAAIMAGTGQKRAKVHAVMLRSAIRNPVIIAIWIGAVIAATGFTLPSSLDRFLAFVGAAAAPTALFAVGGSIALQSMNRATGFAAIGISLVKLTLYPLVVWCALALFLHLDPFWSSAGTVIAALPSAGSNYILAQSSNADADRISAAVVLSTVISLVTVPIVGWLVIPT